MGIALRWGILNFFLTYCDTFMSKYMVRSSLELLWECKHVPEVCAQVSKSGRVLGLGKWWSIFSVFTVCSVKQ